MVPFIQAKIRSAKEQIFHQGSNEQNESGHSQQTDETHAPHHGATLHHTLTHHLLRFFSDTHPRVRAGKAALILRTTPGVRERRRDRVGLGQSPACHDSVGRWDT
jgi:hypothetical protein